MKHKLHFGMARAMTHGEKAFLALVFFAGLLIGGSLATSTQRVYAGNSSDASKQTIPTLIFANPFGEFGEGRYGPRIQTNGGTTIENTSFDVKNPDLGTANTCFNQPFNQIWHAGVDYYDRTIPPVQGGTIPNVQVKAVANGIVRFSQFVNYPGNVVIIEHNTGDGRGVYSVYSHLNTGSTPANVYVGASITRGTVVGTVMPQSYTGAYPAFHTTDDSHLHFEIRTFYDGANIYPSYPNCNKFVPGVGYTYPTHPTVFPNTVSYYIDPISFIKKNEIRLFIPTNYRLYSPGTPEPPQGYP